MSNEHTPEYTPVGTWNDHVIFVEGSGPGGVKEQETLITFYSDGTLSETTAGVIGEGTWSFGNDNNFSYTFNESIGAGAVQVSQQATFYGNDHYTSQGSGMYVLASVPVPGSEAKTETRATRSS